MDPKGTNGTYYVMSLETGREVHGRIVTELPISSNVIDRVNKLGSQQRQMNMRDGGLFFKWLPGHCVNDDDPSSAATDNDVDNTMNSNEDIIPNPHPVLTINDIPPPKTDTTIQQDDDSTIAMESAT